MADSTHSSSTGPSMDQAMEQLMKRGFSELDKADQKASKNGEEKTVKFLGFMEVPESFATVIEGLWNYIADEGVKWIEPHTFSGFKTAGEALGLQGNAVVHGAAIAATTVNAAVRSLAFISPIRQAYANQHTARVDLAKKIAPVLDEIKGKHSSSTLMRVTQADNEMIYFARQRMKMKADTDLKNKVTTLIVNVLPNMAMSFGQSKRMWHDQPLKSKLEGTEAKIADWGKKVLQFGTPAINRTLIHSNERALNHKLTSAYCALDMVVELEKQVADNPKASSFQLPGKKGGALALDKYIEAILFQHQKDMSEISADHTEIRTALKEDVAAVTAPLAEAIRKGELSSLSLVQLIGTGKIIKNHGRSIASVDEVKTLIEHSAAKPATMVHVDPKAHYKEAPYTREDLKAVLKALEGDEKHHFAAMLPDTVLEDAGMPAHEIKEMRVATSQLYEQMLAEAIVGLQAKSDDELKKDGLAKNEITILRTAFKKIEQKGLEAVHELKASPTNARGVEQLIVNVAVPQISKGDTTYLGTLISDGHEKFDDVASERVKDEGRGARGKGKAGKDEDELSDDFAVDERGKLASRESHSKEKSHEYSHTEREKHRATHASGHFSERGN